jgi:hypothetical protein
MSATYEGFPKQSIHAKETFTSALSQGKLQQRIIQVLRNVNSKTFTFEDFGNPSIPGCTVIFEAGIADANSFTSIGEDEAKKVLAALKQEPFGVMDFFCAIRYYKDYTSRKKPLKFDYYITRFIFGEGLVELQVFHERGPRYASPKDMITFLTDRINETSARKILKKIKQPRD